MNTEPYFVETSCGMELISNDRRLKLILLKEIVFGGRMECELFVAHYFVKDGALWERAFGTNQYQSKEDFLSAFEKCPEFSMARKELSGADNDINKY